MPSSSFSSSSPTSPTSGSVPGFSPRKAAVPLRRGLFKDGLWRCNCPSRPPAIKLQTKNHGPNHGRWFYTCQQPTGSKCDFFLWNSDAEAREKVVVMSNSHSEAESGFVNAGGVGGVMSPRTPSRRGLFDQSGLLTPTTERRILDVSPRKSQNRYGGPEMNMPNFASSTRNHGSGNGSPRKRLPSEDASSGTESSGDAWWDDIVTETDEMETFLSQRRTRTSARSNQPADSLHRLDSFSPTPLPSTLAFSSYATPRKAPRTATTTSPGKERLSEIPSGQVRDDLALINTGQDSSSDLFHTQITPTSKTDSMAADSGESGFGSGSGVGAGVMTPMSHPSARSSTGTGPGTAGRVRLPPPSAEISTTPTPSKYTNVLSSDAQSDNSDLAHSALALLEVHKVVLPRKAQDELAGLLNRYDLRTQGIVRGRDITRLALKKKDEQIAQLQGRVEALREEMEMARTVLDGMKLTTRAGDPSAARRK